MNENDVWKDLFETMRGEMKSFVGKYGFVIRANGTYEVVEICKEKEGSDPGREEDFAWEEVRLPEMRALVDFDLFEPVQLRGITFWVDEEGLIGKKGHQVVINWLAITTISALCQTSEPPAIVGDVVVLLDDMSAHCYGFSEEIRDEMVTLLDAILREKDFFRDQIIAQTPKGIKVG